MMIFNVSHFMEIFYFMRENLKYLAKYILLKCDFFFTFISYLAQESVLPAAL